VVLFDLYVFPQLVRPSSLKPNETLDGEGGYTVYGKLVPSREA
jgi:predicted homoserine dehydrogenase-like protein